MRLQAHGLLWLLAGCTGTVPPRPPPVPPEADGAPPATFPTMPPPNPMADAARDVTATPDAAPADLRAPDVAADRGLAPDVVPGTPGAWAQQIRIGLVEVSQAVFIKVGDGATVVAPAMRNSTLIEGRALFLRVHVRPETGFTPRPLRAVLTLGYPDATTRAFDDSKTITAASETEKIDSTFNFLVPADAVKPGATLVAAVYETGAAGPEPATLPRFPPTETADLGVRAGPMVMEVVLMPMRGPSGPLDDSPARRKHLENYLSDVYPVSKMTIRWRAVSTINSIISSDTAFMMMQAARRTDNASPGAYYHMIIAVEDSVEKFLGLGALAGPRPGDAANRIAMTMVTEHQVDSQADTVSHEMGHNLGRNHAPGCNAAGTDARFPYPNTGVGVDGYSIGEVVAGRDHLPNAPGPFKSKARFKDVMGYCYPTWISDYTWNAFADRVRAVTEFTDTTAALEARSLLGYQTAGGTPQWTVVAGDLVAPDVRTSHRARITLRDGATSVVPVVVDHPRSPAGPVLLKRSIALTLPDGEVEKVEVFVDGERFVYLP